MKKIILLMIIFVLLIPSFAKADSFLNKLIKKSHELFYEIEGSTIFTCPMYLDWSLVLRANEEDNTLYWDSNDEFNYLYNWKRIYADFKIEKNDFIYDENKSIFQEYLIRGKLYKGPGEPIDYFEINKSTLAFKIKEDKNFGSGLFWENRGTCKIGDKR